MPKKTKKDKLRADKIRNINKSQQFKQQTFTSSYTFNENSHSYVTKGNKLDNVSTTRFIKKDLIKSIFLTVIGLTALIFLSYTI